MKTIKKKLKTDNKKFAKKIRKAMRVMNKNVCLTWFMMFEESRCVIITGGWAVSSFYGLYALAKETERAKKEGTKVQFVPATGLTLDGRELPEHTMMLEVPDERKDADEHGKYLFAQDLGINVESNRPQCLASWAKYCPDLWGNDYGGEMFLNRRAYCEPDNKPDYVVLYDVIDWWYAVADRLENS